MNTMRVVGIILIAIGVISLVYQGISYTSKDKAADLGPLKIESEKRHTIPLPPILGLAALVGGIVLVIAGGRST